MTENHWNPVRISVELEHGCSKCEWGELNFSVWKKGLETRTWDYYIECPACGEDNTQTVNPFTIDRIEFSLISFLGKVNQALHPPSTRRK